MTDPIVDEVRRVREELIERHGGLDGYLRYCEQQDRRREREQKRSGATKRTPASTAAPSRKVATKRK
jgi:hypothetical protein